MGYQSFIIDMLVLLRIACIGFGNKDGVGVTFCIDGLRMDPQAKMR